MVPVYSVDGSKLREAELPAVFSTPVRGDLILRAFLSEQSRQFQPKGAWKWAGLWTTARYMGRKESYHSLKNRGISRLPREMFPKGRIGKVRIVPFSVKGRRAHPPKPEKVIIERMNKKEAAAALRAAIAATADPELVKARHRIADIPVPVVFDAALEGVSKTRDLARAFTIIAADLERAREGRKPHRKRKGGADVPCSALVVVSGEKPLLKAARNIPGISAITVDKLTVSKLAPGGQPGRLTIWTTAALEKVGEMKA